MGWLAMKLYELVAAVLLGMVLWAMIAIVIEILGR